MNPNLLVHQAREAVAKINNARTAQERQQARAEGVMIKAELERYQNEEKALAVIKASQAIPAGALTAQRGRIIFMTLPDNRKVPAIVELPSGDKVAVAQGAVPVPTEMVPAMERRGYVRFNDDAITQLVAALGGPTPPTNIAPQM